MPGTVPKPTPALPNAKGPPPTSPQVTGPSHTRRMGDSNPRGLSPNTLSKCLNGGWEVFAHVRLRRSARCADCSRDPWIGLDREELLPKLLPLRVPWRRRQRPARSRDATSEPCGLMAAAKLIFSLGLRAAPSG